MLTTASVKNWLRVDFNDDDNLINSLITTSEKLIKDTVRVDITTISDKSVLETAQLFCIAYLYEHREDADNKKLTESLRYILSTEREASF